MRVRRARVNKGDVVSVGEVIVTLDNLSGAVQLPFLDGAAIFPALVATFADEVETNG
ncbi:hypothetical protein Van01_30540 [Micromonospora andamanensis]|uniref:Lipoyl-binding domain-containing protein n=1 Tax=Micromonospora andamanensis TaxID=1287068 RepID=A0ABQ4HW08_9ACTN|nr:hypothetical protein Van01_30540 [Micromonospora andamanensis]